jgi:hypothetical protein
MARGLSFSIGGKTVYADPVKIERKKLYGWSEKIALDDEGAECVSAYTDDTGSVVIPKGGVGSGFLDPDGNWVERAALIAVTSDGKEAPLVPSSYSGVITLDKTVAPEKFLNHTITATYYLGGGELCGCIGNKIYTFDYIYRDGYETTPAFLLQNNGAVFMLLGYDTGFEMLAAKDESIIDEDDDTQFDEDEELDFSFI